MGHLVGPVGQVYSLEIIPEVAQMAAESISALGITNVQIITADGGEGYAASAPYDRAIFTAGAYDLPSHFYEQIKEGGLLLVVIKSEGGGDNLFLLRKTDNHFESLESMPCGFVQLAGKYKLNTLELITLETLPEWIELQQQEIAKALLVGWKRERRVYVAHAGHSLLSWYHGTVVPRLQNRKSGRSFT